MLGTCTMLVHVILDWERKVFDSFDVRLYDTCIIKFKNITKYIKNLSTNIDRIRDLRGIF